MLRSVSYLLIEFLMFAANKIDTKFVIDVSETAGVEA